MLKYYIIERKNGFVSGMFDDFAKAVSTVESWLQQDGNKDAKFEIVARVAEVKRAPHPVQIKLSQVFYDA